MTDFTIDNIIINALKEDMPNGDVTVDNLISDDEISLARLISKDNGIISGIEVFCRVFELLDKNIDIKVFVKDGEKVSNRQLLATLNGKTKTILKETDIAILVVDITKGITNVEKEMIDLSLQKTL